MFLGQHAVAGEVLQRLAGVVAICRELGAGVEPGGNRLIDHLERRHLVGEHLVAVDEPPGVKGLAGLSRLRQGFSSAVGTGFGARSKDCSAWGPPADPHAKDW